ncbi:MAG: winged helix-turn-helix domain-containing protein [Saprospiraceae bacterium]|nr:winged helix-turn-helix domain-containing protein [Saprospiraceae bacterium]
MRFVPLLALPIVALLLPVGASKPTAELPKDQLNLALRRTADALLRASGDSTSRIPAVSQISETTWRIYLAQSFDYDRLPELLQNSLDLHRIHQPYYVTVRRCLDDVIDLGYHYADVAGEDAVVTCGGREMPEGCHYIEVVFAQQPPQPPVGRIMAGICLLLTGGWLAYRWLRRQKQSPETRRPATSDIEWLHFGNSRLDPVGQILIANGVSQSLTFRETKLLRLFAARPGQLLERETILQQVWADEGVLVGRSIDMFVSRLRKKLAPDPAVAITAVHGVGYRMETGLGMVTAASLDI